MLHSAAAAFAQKHLLERFLLAEVVLSWLRFPHLSPSLRVQPW